MTRNMKIALVVGGAVAAWFIWKRYKAKPTTMLKDMTSAQAAQVGAITGALPAGLPGVGALQAAADVRASMA